MKQTARRNRLLIVSREEGVRKDIPRVDMNNNNSKCIDDGTYVKTEKRHAEPQCCVEYENKTSN